MGASKGRGETMKTIFRSAVLSCVVLACVAGCNPTVEEAVQDFAPAWCARQAECLPTFYAVAYPQDAKAGDGRTTQCVASMVDSIDSDKRRRASACSDDELSACKADIAKLSCESITSSTLGNASSLPSSCQKC